VAISPFFPPIGNAEPVWIPKRVSSLSGKLESADTILVSRSKEKMFFEKFKVEESIPSITELPTLVVSSNREHPIIYSTEMIVQTKSRFFFIAPAEESYMLLFRTAGENQPATLEKYRLESSSKSNI
jgi:hypothetical protein